MIEEMLGDYNHKLNNWQAEHLPDMLNTCNRFALSPKQKLLVEKNYAEVVEGKGRNAEIDIVNGDFRGDKKGYEYIVSYNGEEIGDTVNKQEVQAVVDWLANNISDLLAVCGNASVLAENKVEMVDDDGLVDAMSEIPPF